MDESRTQLAKAPTGIKGLDEITGGGLPKGRPTLICGGAGCGKSILAMEFLVRGARQFSEPGVFVAFEETTKDLIQNVASLGFDLDGLIASKKMVLDSVFIKPSDLQESGECDLEGLFVRLGYAIDSIGAKRVVLDTIDSLFAGLPNPLVLRAELGRLFRWLSDKGVTSIITRERGEGTLTRQGLEEYVSDCVIVLDHRVSDQVSSRRLLVVKYRGSTHGTNQYPFVIDEDGISVLPVPSLGLGHIASTDRIATGIASLDAMLGGAGYYRGSSVLVSGAAGTGKTSIAACFAEAACGRSERTLFFALEESASQIIRNMRSIGIDLEPWMQQGLLQFPARRPRLTGLEMHLATMHKAINAFKPQVVIVDPLNSLIIGGNGSQVKAMLLRLDDLLKMSQITALFTSLTSGSETLEQTGVAVSSSIDTWLSLRDIETGGERNRGLYVLKSRGMAHSNQIREFVLTDHGVALRDAHVGPGGALTGSARLAHEARERGAQAARQQQVEGRQLELEAQMAAMRAESQVREAESLRIVRQEHAQGASLAPGRADTGPSHRWGVTPN